MNFSIIPVLCKWLKVGEIKKVSIITFLIIGILWSGVAFANLSDGLVAYFPFSGNANDESGNGNNGTVHGATLTSDRFGNANSAYSFDGVDDYIQLSNGVTPTDNLTIAALINISGTTGFNQYIYSDYGIGFLINPENYLTLIRYTDSDWASISESQTKLEIGSQYYIAASYGGSVVNLYINGNLDTSSSTPFVSLDKPDLVREVIGKAYTNRFYFKGIMDELSIYGKTLTDEEIKQSYASVITQPVPEPTSLILLVTGGGLTLIFRRIIKI